VATTPDVKHRTLARRLRFGQAVSALLVPALLVACGKEHEPRTARSRELRVMTFNVQRWPLEPGDYEAPATPARDAACAAPGETTASSAGFVLGG
jgi:hypothetical protein